MRSRIPSNPAGRNARASPPHVHALPERVQVSVAVPMYVTKLYKRSNLNYIEAASFSGFALP